MTPPEASVVVVSRERPADLTRCLRALSQQDHPRFEVIVVADPPGVAAAQATGMVLKIIPFDEANISAARNLGLARAAGEVVAYIDDDACAEPTWLRRLVAPFSDPRVEQATGFVRGRNGITFQWKASAVDRFGGDHAMTVPEAEVSLHKGDPTRTVKTVGTNCAFRAEALRAVGGFDPAMRFFLEDADINLRLAARGGLTAVVPLAQVQHAFAASSRRRADRVPLSLYEIGASTAVFLRRHAPEAAAELPEAVIRRERGRLWRHLLRLRIGPQAARDLMAGLRQGWEDGLARPEGPGTMRSASVPFLPLPDTGPRAGLFLWHSADRAAEARLRAGAEVASGHIVTLLRLEPGLRRHQSGFAADGFWWQTGGKAGRSDRKGPIHWRISAEDRAEIERKHWARLRPTGTRAAGA